ncbi:MAG: hypothetical protein CMJ58_12060 [Planctomycetaceae bacterium]|nr:hypothetical protein [Planctomycetaceae bacterium]
MRSWLHTMATKRASWLAVGIILTLAAAETYGTTGCTPPPCAADGTCRPNRREWGWYHTHWRPWPGEKVAPTPTAAGTDAEEAEDELGGLVLPDPAKEGATSAEKAGDEAVESDEAPIGPIPGPGADDAGPLGPGEGAPAIDPFGYDQQPSDPTAQLSLPAAAGVAMTPPNPNHRNDPPPMPSFVQPLPAVAPEGSIVQPAMNVEPAVAPNLQGDDAPPALPPSLLGAAGGRGFAPTATAAPIGRPPAPLRVSQVIKPLPPVSDEPITLGQPRSLRPATADVRQVSWQTPGGIALVNPAGAVEVEPGADGAQQAIYYEVSDEEPVIAQ